MAIPQTAYNLVPATLTPGQIADDSNINVVSYVASEAIPFGCVVEEANGEIRRPQQTSSSLGPIAGVAMYRAMKESSLSGSTAIAWQAGDVVPVLRKGRIAALWSGTTQPTLGTVNIMHSSTIATNRGYVTDAATSTTAGSEISAGPSCILSVAPTGISNTCLLELNLPGA